MNKYFEHKERMILLVQAQGEYINLLERALGEVSGLAYVHGFTPDKKDVELGSMLRDKINFLRKDGK